MSSRLAERSAVRAGVPNGGVHDRGDDPPGAAAASAATAQHPAGSMPRMLFLHSRLDISGGSERMLVRVAHMARRRAAVDLGIVWEREVRASAEDLAVFDAVFAVRAPVAFSARTLSAHAAAQRRLRRWAAPPAPRAIVAFDLPAALRAALLGRRLGVPAAWMCQESTVVIAPAARRRTLHRRALFALLRRSLARVVCINGDAPRGLIDLGFAPERVRLIRNGVPVDVLAARRLDGSARSAWRRAHAIPEGDLVAVCAARIAPWKGHATLLAAVREAAHAGVRVTLVCVGAVDPGGETHAAALRRQTAELGIAAQVVWAGFQTDIGAWLGMADVALLASRGEAGPLALTEAAAVGLPLIGSRVEGVTDVIVHGETGLLFSPGDAADCGRALVGMARDDAERERLGRNARADARRRFDAAASEASWLRLLDELLTGGLRR